MSAAPSNTAIVEARQARKTYLKVFLLLVVLTIAEVGVVLVPGIGQGLLVLALVLMALAKAGLVLVYFMHLGHETLGLKLTVVLPFLMPAILAFVLIADAAWRYLR
jgi:caa(3)-type oxidase subunit IV